jgi:hypothetical protein
LIFEIYNWKVAAAAKLPSSIIEREYKYNTWSKKRNNNKEGEGCVHGAAPLYASVYFASFY